MTNASEAPQSGSPSESLQRVLLLLNQALEIIDQIQGCEVAGARLQHVIDSLPDQSSLDLADLSAPFRCHITPTRMDA